MGTSMNPNDVIVPFSQVMKTVCPAIVSVTPDCQTCVSGLTPTAASTIGSIINSCGGDYIGAASTVLNYQASAAVAILVKHYQNNPSYNPAEHLNDDNDHEELEDAVYDEEY